MTKIEPFASDLLAAASASKVVGPGYDALSDHERVHHAATNPLSFLGVLAPGDGGIDASTERLRSLIEGGHFDASGPALFLYRLTVDDHHQTAVIADVHVDEFLDSRIRVHETTRTEKEDELLDFTLRTRINSSPVCLTYPAITSIDECVAGETTSAAVLDFTTVDGVRHQIWKVDEAAAVARLADAFTAVQAAYVTDGHHRAATAVRLADLLGGEDARRVLVALFPHDQLRILPFHRIVRDAGPASAAIERLADRFAITEFDSADNDAEPDRPGRFTLWIEDRWFHLDLRDLGDLTSPVDSLDAVRAQRHILDPVFGIVDPRADSRLDYVSGGNGLAALALHAGAGNAAIGIAPVAIEQILAIADAGLTMPPKSTWFDPKVRSGIWIRHR